MKTIGLVVCLIIVVAGLPGCTPPSLLPWDFQPRGALALVSDRTGSPDIYLLNADTGVLTNLTNTPDLDEADPAWSRDGCQIAFSVRTQRGSQIEVMNGNGSGRRLLGNARGNAVTPAWSSDGQHVYFSTHHIESIGDVRGRYYPLGILARLDVIGGAVVELTTLRPYDGPTDRVNNPDTVSNPTLSPNGTMLLYQNNTSLVLSDPNTENQVLLRRDMNQAIMRDPAWSPTGQQIAFATAYLYDVATLPDAAVNGIYVGERDGDTWRLLVSGSLGNPTWSYHGPYIAYDAVMSMDSGYRPRWGVVITSTDDATQHWITPHDEQNYYAPSWRPTAFCYD